ncbi:MAG: YjgP/YjgQ family permease [Flavobacteriaceae bacterium TMED121]|nr:MAG: YjgP/YjgQ family permease [Flavobacteriaceae bacterium TMED121]
MKIIDRYIISQYLRRLVSIFGICMLIFIVQTFWLFIDDLAGKGLDFETIFKFLIYYSPKLIPIVLPLSVLLASLMTFGDLAENYEFAAMKSTGISLIRCMSGLFLVHIMIGVGSYYFSNHVIPYGELKSYNLRRNLAKLKPAIAIREGIFNDLGQMNIKVKRKYGFEQRLLEDVIIHEKTTDHKNRIVIKAKRGELKSKTTDATLQLVLYDGNRYEEIIGKDYQEKLRLPHAKVHFEKYVMNIDLSKFNNIDLNEENYTSTFRMQKVNQLQVSIDSLERDFREQKRVFSDNFNKKHYTSQIKTVKIQEYEPDSLITANLLNIVENKTKWRRRQSINNAITDVKSILRSLENKKRTFFIYQKLINLHKITLFDRFTIIFACIFLFLIGASLGAIIKKGGLGLPMVLSVLIFLSYHYIGIFGKNAAEDNSVTPYLASWISTIIIAPFAFYLTRRASYDEGFVNLDFLFIPLKHFFKKISSSK